MVSGQTRRALRLTGLAIGLFYATILAVIAGTSLRWIVLGQSMNRPTVLFLSLLPLVVPWIAIRMLRKRIAFHKAHPENAALGMAIGFGVALPLTIGFAVTAEFMNLHSWRKLTYLISVFAPVTIGMALGSLLAIRFSRTS